MKRVLPLVALATTSVVAATPQPGEATSTPPPTVSEQVRPADPVPQEVRELHKQVDQLQKALLGLQEQLDRAPHYLDQSNSPITGS